MNRRSLRPKKPPGYFKSLHSGNLDVRSQRQEEITWKETAIFDIEVRKRLFNQFFIHKTFRGKTDYSIVLARRV